VYARQEPRERFSDSCEEPAQKQWQAMHKRKTPCQRIWATTHARAQAWRRTPPRASYLAYVKVWIACGLHPIRKGYVRLLRRRNKSLDELLDGSFASDVPSG